MHQVYSSATLRNTAGADRGGVCFFVVWNAPEAFDPTIFCGLFFQCHEHVAEEGCSTNHHHQLLPWDKACPTRCHTVPQKLLWFFSLGLSPGQVCGVVYSQWRQSLACPLDWPPLALVHVPSPLLTLQALSCICCSSSESDCLSSSELDLLVKLWFKFVSLLLS